MEKQIVLESNAEYEAFVDKFKPSLKHKLTTDDCIRWGGKTLWKSISRKGEIR